MPCATALDSNERYTDMEVRAVAKYVRVQPRKVRQVAREVRGKSAVDMVNVLRFHPSKSAFALRKVLISAIANAEENHGLNGHELRIRAITVDEGPKTKRIQARAMGRANRIEKKTSHITVVVEDFEPEAAVKPHGTKAKARPSLATKAKKAKGEKPSKKEEVKEEVVAEEVAAEATEAEVAAEGSEEQSDVAGEEKN